MRPAAAALPPTRRDTEITAGIPGLGLSGLFALLCALSLPLSRRRRVPVTRLLCLAVIMTAAVILTWEAIVEGITVLHGAGAAGSHGLTGRILGHGFWQVPVIAVSASIMVLVIAAGEALLQLVGVKPTPTPPPVRSCLPSHQYRPNPPARAPRHRLPAARRAK